MHPLDNIRIVLCETSHPGNIGAAARAMKTMGISDLRLVNPERFPDREAQWRATKGADILDRAQVHATLDDALKGAAFVIACSARNRDIAVVNVGVREAALRAAGVAASQPVAFVFGNESAGLSNDAVNKCQLLASIPADPQYSSLNLGSAVQVVAYELRMATVQLEPAEAPGELAAHEAIEGFYEQLERMMVDTGFFDPAHPTKLMPRIRRLFGRTRLEREEVNILRGILKAITQPKKR
jgi:tRNA/rRNA methyltransferase